MRLTSSFHKISALDHHVKVIQGSKGAGKTYAILMRWILMALTKGTTELCSIVSDTMPTLRRGAIEDFEKILFSNNIPFRRTKSPYVYKVGGWTFKFFSVDDEKKARGGRMDRLFVNEADRVPWSIARHLIDRTHIEVILDFNPVVEFWAHKQYVNVRDCDFLKLTYKSNEMLPQREVDAIERYAPWGLVPDENYWRVYGLGEIGFVEGMIFKNYQNFREYPDGDFIESLGVDFGDVDPMTCVHTRFYPETQSLYWREIFYASEAPIDELAKAIKNDPIVGGQELHVLCDHNPKLIRMLRGLDIMSMNANKRGGLISDIRSLKQYKIFTHEDSLNLNKEMDSYSYKKQRDHFTNYPDQSCDEHAIDAGRYGSIQLI